MVTNARGRALWLTQGYLKDPDGLEKLPAGRWMHTGNLPTIDTDGYVRIANRLKDLIKSGGEWRCSLQPENLILRHSGVPEMVVIALPDPKWGERPLALVVPKLGQEASEAALRKQLQEVAAKGAIPRFSLPERIVMGEALPKTSVGKLDNKELRERYAP
jgi:fatty-acyl-CoA synthase